MWPSPPSRDILTFCLICRLLTNLLSLQHLAVPLSLVSSQTSQIHVRTNTFFNTLQPSSPMLHQLSKLQGLFEMEAAAEPWWHLLHAINYSRNPAKWQRQHA